MIHAHEEASFVQWMRQTNNMFTGEEYKARLGIWMTNKRLVQEHNKAKDFLLSMNHLAHYTPAEYKAICGFKPNAAPRAAAKASNFKAPTAIDWRDSGVVNGVKDQASCGSCWAFSTIQAMESQWAINHKTLYSLSEQNLVDCVTSCYGCNGGLMEPAYDYVIKSQSGKFMLETDYPYTGKDGNCKFSASKGITQVKGYITIVEDSEADLEAKVAQYGPAAIAIDASHYSFQLYSSGIYDEASCAPENLDHAVGCVGYGTEGGKNYWIVRNSWGTSWGENGYVRMIKDKNNQCGEATAACIPQVA
jgi:cathepsin L